MTFQELINCLKNLLVLNSVWFRVRVSVSPSGTPQPKHLQSTPSLLLPGVSPTATNHSLLRYSLKWGYGSCTQKKASTQFVRGSSVTTTPRFKTFIDVCICFILLFCTSKHLSILIVSETVLYWNVN